MNKYECDLVTFSLWIIDKFVAAVVGVRLVLYVSRIMQACWAAIPQGAQIPPTSPLLWIRHPIAAGFLIIFHVMSRISSMLVDIHFDNNRLPTFSKSYSTSEKWTPDTWRESHGNVRLGSYVFSLSACGCLHIWSIVVDSADSRAQNMRE